MKQLLHFVTLGVDNLDAMKNFYKTKFGWNPVKDDNGIVFFKLNGFIFSLYPRQELADDAGVPSMGKGFKGMTFSINFNSEKEVDEQFSSLRKKGVNVVREPEKVFWGGYRGYIEDIEHNLWELAYNPFLEMDEHGNVSGHP